MSRARRLCAAALALVVATGGTGAAARAERARPVRLTIAFTGDVIGYLEPCG
jgi:hypothetical protein